MQKLFEQLKIYLKILGLNRKATILSFIGLGVSLALISEGLIFVYSFQYGAFVDYAGTPTKQLTVDLITQLNIGDYDAYYDELYNITDTIIDNLGARNRIRKMDWYYENGYSLDTIDDNNNTAFLTHINLYGIPSDYFSVLQQLLCSGSMPQQEDNVIIVAKNSTFSFTNLDNPGLFPLYKAVFGGWVRIGNINISGAITKEAFLSYNGTNAFDFQAMADYFTEEFMLVPAENHRSGETKCTGRFSFWLEDINSYDINNEIELINSIGQEMSRAFEERGKPLTVHNHIHDTLVDFQSEFLLFQIYGLLFLSPLMIVALYLSSFSANLLKRRQKHHIGQILQRGGTRVSVWFLLIIQMLEIAISGLILSFVIGYPFSWLMLKSSGFLLFGAQGVLPAINLAIFYILLLLSFVFTFLINSKDLWEYQNLTILEAHEEIEYKDPFWKRLYLDIALLIIGIALWFIVRFQLDGTSPHSFAYGFGTTAPVIIILGGILTASRLYVVISELLAKLFWKTKELGAISLSFFRISRRKKSSIRGMLLLSLTFALLFSAIVCTESYNEHQKEVAYYEVSSDILIRNVGSLDNTIKDGVLNISGVESATYVLTSRQIVTFGSLTISYTIVGVNSSEYAKTIYFEEEYLGGIPPEEFFNSIEDENDALLQTDQKNFLLGEDDNNISLPAQKYIQGIVNFDLEIVNTYDYMPRFYDGYNPSSSTIFRFAIIGNYDLVEDLAYHKSHIGYDLVVKVKSDYDTASIAEKIHESVNREIITVDETYSEYTNGFRNRMLFGSLNTSLLASILIIIAILSLMLIIQLEENSLELKILRIFGFKPKQFFSLFLSESLFMVIFSIVVGSLFGSFSSVAILKLLTFKIPIPPNEMIFSGVQISLEIIAIIFVAIITTLITVGVVFRRERKSKGVDFERNIV